MNQLEPESLLNEDIPIALHNQDFIKGPEARSLRILGEYLHPKDVFEKEKITDTIVFFGSARIGPPNDLKSPLSQAVRGNKISEKMSEYYRSSMELAEELTKWSIQQKEESGRGVLVCTGGGPGIMEAANRGANNVSGDSIGLNILLPHEQHPNHWISSNLNFNFQYFFMRKYWFLYYARVMIAFPGGFGTMDELFETLTLRQTRIIEGDIEILLYGKEFWNNTINFKYMAENGLIGPDDLNLFTIVNSVPEALEKCTNIISNNFKNG